MPVEVCNIRVRVRVRYREIGVLGVLGLGNRVRCSLLGHLLGVVLGFWLCTPT